MHCTRSDGTVDGKGIGVLMYVMNALRANHVKWKNQIPEENLGKIKCDNHELFV